MKNNFLKTIIFTGIISLVAMPSCKKKIDDAYLNPNAAVVQPIESILPGVIGGFTWFSSTQGTTHGLITDGQFVNRYIQYMGINTSADTWGQMSMVGGAVDNGGSVWATVYYGQGANVNRIIEWGLEQEKWDYVGAALAVRAWGWLELTQEYEIGIIKEAWVPNKTSFKYDNADLVFDSCRAVCHRALAYLSRTDGNVSQANLAKGDAYFNGGDVNKWKKFVYGILARSYNDLSYKNIYAANSYAFADSAIKYADLAMTANADNATVKLAGGTINGQNNFWGPLRNNFGSSRQGDYVARLMSGSDTTAFAGVFDPRCWYMLSENLNGTFKGFYPWAGSSGLTTNDYPKNFFRNSLPTSTSPPTVDSSRYLYGNTSPWPIMTASEMQFIIAEAAFRKNDKITALAAYTNAISLNFDMLTTEYPQNIPAGKDITPAVKAAYLANPVVIPASPNNLTLTKIMNQKYIALYAWGAQETWVDMRKFHYTDIDPATTKQVYVGFIPPSGANLIATNLGNLTYRMRPRFNSEYLYDVPELTRIGAYQFPEYNTYKTWFAIP
ncbi:MAG: SusD/RagB family nutrient-binding outer membrane lipoprotein [Chitinophagaceae bacterium]|nr:SusD/RagB family nutrient-binding outer membrane lipoprotein [Chitinophagaceae bacterium]